MKRELKITGDGSNTLYIRDLNESYHSTHGALQEAKHVFINNGLKLKYDCNINILELGFGTGLNVLVTIDDFLKTDKNHIIHYFTVEKHPVSAEEISGLAYGKLFKEDIFAHIFHQIHAVEWNKPHEILPNFFLTKFDKDFFEIETLELPKINLVYFDCFGARVQPELWEMPLLKIVADTMEPGGLLTTYACKGSFRRALEALGFAVEKKAGPPGKREMLNAVKI